VLILRLHDRRLELEPEALRSDGAALPVGPTPARLLFYLASNRDRIVPTEELLREVWDGAHVTPSSVQQAVRTLRSALDGDGSAFIRTVRGLGYQLGPLIEVSEDRSAVHELPLVGRSHQLGRLSDVVESARAGRGRLVLVAGAPGMGKTRLLQELEALAPRRGFWFLCGRCPEQSGAAALWPWEEILRGVVEAERTAVETLPRSDLALLQGAFPALGAEQDASPALDPGSARFRLYEAVRRVLVACARTRPLVVAIDDLHRADETSVHLLEWMASRNASERIVLVAAYRDLPAQQDRVLRSAVASLLRLPGAGLERLADLTREQVEEAARLVLGPSVSAADAEILWRRSAGNPFLLKTLVHHLGRAPGSAHALFPEAEEAVRQHVQEVSPRTQALLRHAAVLGREIDPERLRRLAGATPEQVSAALEEARAAGLVESGPHAVPRFVHALVAEALHESFDVEAKLALHARATEILEEDARPDAGALAEHAWLAAPRIGAARAAAHCERAAEAALGRYAFEEAARMYERALELSRDAAPERRLGLLLALGRSSALGGQVERADETLGQAIELAKATGDDEAQARAVLALAVMRQDDDTSVDGRWLETLEVAIAAHRAETPLRAELISRLAAAVWPLPPRERARVLASESARLVQRSDDADAQASVLTRAYRILQTGPGDDATRAETARQIGVALERTRDPIIALNARLMLLWEALQVGDPRAFALHVGRIVEQAEAVGAPHAEWYALVARTSRAHLMGQLERAEELADQGLAVGEAIGLRTARLNHLLQLLSLRTDQGRLAEMEAVLEAATEGLLHPLSSRLSWSLACLSAGRAGPARETLREFCADPSRVDLDSFWCPTAYMLADVAVGLGDAEAAAVVVPHVAALRGRHAQVALGFCHWGAMEWQLGRLLALLERFDEAEAAFEAGLARDRRFGAFAAVARGQHDLGALLLQRDRLSERPRARTLLEEAHALAEHIGMAEVKRACGKLLADA
jgi:DNA-binding winged helix-turn-helix (wHTH) protein/tetratricopeptide (TPR) repeat protein